MKTSPVVLTIAAALTLILPVLAHAQATQAYSGGDGGTWDAGVTQDWDANSDTWTNGNNSTFNTAGTVNVSGAVNANFIQFNSADDVVVNGPGVVTVSGQANFQDVLENNASHNVTFNASLLLDDTAASDRFNINNNNTGTLTFQDLGFSGATVRGSGQAVELNSATSTSDFVINGSFSGTAQNAGRLIFNGAGSSTDAVTSSGASLTLAGNLNTNTNTSNVLEVSGGVVYLGTSNLGTGTLNLEGNNSTTPTLLTKGAQSVSNTVNGANYFDVFNPADASSGSVIVGGSTADNSSYAAVNMIVTGLTVTAVNGGRVNIGNLTGSDVTGLIKIGDGTLVLSDANSYGLVNTFPANPTTAPYAADIRNGTVLVTNTSGSAFGNNTGTVQVEKGATLGGSGISTQQVVTAAAGSMLAPGDSGGDLGTVAISTLHLLGGLIAINGLTMDFKVDGTNNDVINFANALMTLNGIVTINLTGTPTPDTGIGNFGVFTLLTNIGTGSTSHGLNIDTLASTISDDPSIIVTAPTGYVVESSGYAQNFSGPGSFYYVQLEAVAVPEPSTYAMLFGCLVLLPVISRFSRKLTV